MKTKIIFLIGLCFFLSCSKKEEAQVPAEPSEVQSEVTPTPAQKAEAPEETVAEAPAPTAVKTKTEQAEEARKAEEASKGPSSKNCLTVGQKGSASGRPGPKGWRLDPPCCHGLADRESLDVCGKGHGGAYVYACLACGDGKCDSRFESPCNCPEDCK